MSWNRLKQATRETLKASAKDQKTDIPSDIGNLFLKAEGVEKLFTTIIQDGQTYFPDRKLKTKNADDPVKGQPLYVLGDSFKSLSVEYHQDRALKEFFQLSHQSCSQLAKLKWELDGFAQENYFEPKKVLIDEHVKNAEKHYEKLKEKRLDLDAKKHKLKSERKSDGQKVKKYELDVSQAQERFDDELESIRNLLNPINNDLEMGRQQAAQTADLLSKLKEYFLSSYQLLEQLDQSVHFEDLKKAASQPVPKPQPFYQPNSNNQSPVQSPLMTPSSPLSVHQQLPRQHLNPPAIQPKPSHFSQAAPTAPPAQYTAPAPIQVLPVMSNHTNTPSPLTPSRVKKCCALYDFKKEQNGDLGFEKGDLIQLTSQNGEWWEGKNIRTGDVGIFPSNYVQLL